MRRSGFEGNRMGSKLLWRIPVVNFVCFYPVSIESLMGDENCCGTYFFVVNHFTERI